MKTFDVYYQKPQVRLERAFEAAHVTLNNVQKTHKLVRSAVVASDIDNLFYLMQGEIWSPNGEARPLIQKLGLSHTSMSVGDVAHDVAEDKWYVCEFMGWKEL